MRTFAFMIVLLGIVTMAYAQPPVDLSDKISATSPINGKCAPILGQKTDTLPCDVQASVYFRSLGSYLDGTLHKGDFVFYETISRSELGEWRRIIRAGRCGNPAKGKYFVPAPRPKKPEITVTEVRPQLPVEVTRVETKIVPVVIPLPSCPPPCRQPLTFEKSGYAPPARSWTEQGPTKRTGLWLWKTPSCRTSPPPPSPYCPPAGTPGGNPPPYIPPPASW